MRGLIKSLAAGCIAALSLTGTAQAQDVTIGYQTIYNPWKVAIADGKFEEAKLAEDQELDTSKLDDMKNALDDLKIVDVSPKPEGLSGDLKATGNVYADQETQQSLANRGFYLVAVDDKFYELRSNEGETRVLMKDGVEYVLRFGQVAGGSTGMEKAKPEEGEKEGEEEDSSDGLNRYLFVMAEFNADAIKKPELEPLPELPAEDANDAEKKEGEKAEAEKADADKEEAKEGEEEEEEDPAAKVKAERERIEKENKRKQEQYEEELEKGKEHVKELNERFADWYYVIADDVYQKIHLTRADILKKKEKEEDEKGDEAESAPIDTSTTPAALDDLKKDVPATPAQKAEKKDSPASAKDEPKAEEKPAAEKAEDKPQDEKPENKAKPADPKPAEEKPEAEEKQSVKAEPAESDASAKPEKAEASDKAPAKPEKPEQEAPAKE